MTKPLTCEDVGCPCATNQAGTTNLRGSGEERSDLLEKMLVGERLKSRKLRQALEKFMEDENWQANTGQRLNFPTDAYRLGEAALKEGA